MDSIIPWFQFWALAGVQLNPMVQFDDRFNCVGPTTPNLYGITMLIIRNIVNKCIVIHIRTC